MGAGVSQSRIKRKLNQLARKYVGVEFRVLYASNGEVAILPVNPKTGKPECTDPQRFVPPDIRVCNRCKKRAALDSYATCKLCLDKAQTEAEQAGGVE